MPIAHSKEHVVLWGVAQAGPDGISRETLLGRNDMLNRARSGNGPVKMLAKKLGNVKKAEQTMKDDDERDEAAKAYLNVVIGELVKKGRLLEDEGMLSLGVMPRGYNPLDYELKQTKATSVQNLRNGRKRVKGWTNFVNPDLDEGVVSHIEAQMARTGWKHGKVLLDSDGDVADGKHRVAAAERLGIDWRTKHSMTIKDEVRLWEEVLQRNLNRWSLSKGDQAKAYTRFLSLRPDLTVSEKIIALREGMNGVAERTQQRATSKARGELKKERDEEVFEAVVVLGRPQIEVAKEYGVSQATVSNILKKLSVSAKLAETDNPQVNSSEPEIIGVCCFCNNEIRDDERRGKIREPKPGFRIGAEVRKGRGGANAWLGPFVEVADFHYGCIIEEAQAVHNAKIPVTQ
jgi:hypothetical protein